MSVQTESPVGVVISSQTPPEEVSRIAVQVEQLGFGELWVPEDYFFFGGMTGSAAALAATSRIQVGLGVASIMARHPALFAMETASLARSFPGRFLPGVGLGVPHWVNQMGLMPRTQLGALREGVSAVRSLLAGEELTRIDSLFHFDAVALAHPVSQPPPIFMGVIGPKMLNLSGEVADGTVVSVLASPPYVRWLRERVAEGQAKGQRTGHHRVVTFALYGVDPDPAAAKAALRDVAAFYLAAVPKSALTDTYGIAAELWDMYERGGTDAAALIAREMPDAWVEDLVIAGDPDECAAKIQALLDAGSDSVCLFPTPVQRTDEVLRLTASDVLPRVAR